MDPQPDVCKDYKQTGYCGYGDSCKFMHDRGVNKKRAAPRRSGRGTTTSQIKSDKGEGNCLPYACFICRASFTRPVVTKCEHFFCDKCAAV